MIKLFKALYGSIIYGLSYITPKSNKIWVFGSMGGQAFSDSPKYIYNYIYNHNLDVEAIWLTRSPLVFRFLKTANKRVYFINSFKGVWFALRASFGIVSHGLIDINRYSCARLKIIECWHGVPLKPVLLSDKKKEAIQKRNRAKKLKFIFPFLNKQIQYNDFAAICGSGDLCNRILKKVFGSKSPILNLGFPRLDGLFSHETNLTSLKLGELKKNKKNIGIYLPTYRQKEEFDIVNYFTENSEQIYKSLEQTDTYLFVKMHSFEKQSPINKLKFERIIYIDNEDIKDDIYSILGLFDFLITDYSSVIFDFLILARPVFLLIPDRDKYIKSNGDFVYDYLELGLNVYNDWGSCMDHIKINKEFDRPIYNKLRTEIHRYKDGNSSKRLFDYLNSK